MKMRNRRKMRTVPREYTFNASVHCEMYEVKFGSMIVPMTSKRVKITFKMQSAETNDYLRKMAECGAISATIRR